MRSLKMRLILALMLLALSLILRSQWSDPFHGSMEFTSQLQVDNGGARGDRSVNYCLVHRDFLLFQKMDELPIDYCADLNWYEGFKFWEKKYALSSCHHAVSLGKSPIRYQDLIAIMARYVKRPTEYVVSGLWMVDSLYAVKMVHTSDFSRVEIREGVKTLMACEEFYPSLVLYFTKGGNFDACSTKDGECESVLQKDDQ